MVKLSVAILVCSTVAAHADVVEPTVEPMPAEQAPAEVSPSEAGGSDVVGPSMVAPRPAIRPDTIDETPPLSTGNLFGEALLGGLFAVGGAIGGGYLGATLELRNGCSGEFCGLGGAILGGAAGLAFVTPIGVYLAGNTGGQTGSLGATIGGGALGTLAGIAAFAASESEVGLPLLVIGPVAGSMIGFNATRRYKTPRKRVQWAPVASVSSGNSTFGVAGAF